MGMKIRIAITERYQSSEYGHATERRQSIQLPIMGKL